jgi:hypothetical protein
VVASARDDEADKDAEAVDDTGEAGKDGA